MTSTPTTTSRTGEATPTRVVRDHLDAVAPALQSLQSQADLISAWGTELAHRLMAGQRLLVAGNGGSAAEAQHLTAELVGRFDGDRQPFAAISLHADTSSLTAIGNDYGYDEVFARQVRAHGRPGDVLMLLTTSGRSPNLLAAAEAARAVGVSVWAMTGPAPNPLAEFVGDEVLAVDGATPNVQEGHLIAVHSMCRVFDAEVKRSAR
ncbi:SIS domain-containing protein [Aeromicrobium phragmitis]|uniref:SIS domain-containing protein n=1 Tax=Aeromicrobium phragmitis TaxID=2478914 RepID=A0A3L8PJV3_9ACTN|nr:SIS domain-containing protein [Aeromicrobium phragmitis]RLV55627.1 SIS domain-containing protein [Aeromicrobium phragmitis]